MEHLDKFSTPELKKICRILKKDIYDHFKGYTRWNRETLIKKIDEKYDVQGDKLMSKLPVALEEIFKRREEKVVKKEAAKQRAKERRLQKKLGAHVNVENKTLDETEQAAEDMKDNIEEIKEVVEKIQDEKVKREVANLLDEMITKIEDIEKNVEDMKGENEDVMPGSTDSSEEPDVEDMPDMPETSRPMKESMKKKMKIKIGVKPLSKLISLINEALQKRGEMRKQIMRIYASVSKNKFSPDEGKKMISTMMDNTMMRINEWAEKTAEDVKNTNNPELKVVLESLEALLSLHKNGKIYKIATLMDLLGRAKGFLLKLESDSIINESVKPVRRDIAEEPDVEDMPDKPETSRPVFVQMIGEWRKDIKDVKKSQEIKGKWENIIKKVIEQKKDEYMKKSIQVFKKLHIEEPVVKQEEPVEVKGTELENRVKIFNTLKDAFDKFGGYTTDFKKVLRTLRFQYHPDKNPDSLELAKKLFLYATQVADALGEGEEPPRPGGEEVEKKGRSTRDDYLFWKYAFIRDVDKVRKMISNIKKRGTAKIKKALDDYIELFKSFPEKEAEFYSTDKNDKFQLNRFIQNVIDPIKAKRQIIYNLNHELGNILFENGIMDALNEKAVRPATIKFFKDLLINLEKAVNRAEKAKKNEDIFDVINKARAKESTE